MKIVVTAGPTREMIDRVRFLSNLSSGRTGYAVAGAAAALGHEVILISGPVHLESPAGVSLVPVVSAHDMHQAVLAHFADADAVIMTAAVADYRPKSVHDGKMKKQDGPLVLELERTQDILKDLGARKGSQILIGFALEVADPEANARRKLEAKNLDLVVLNGPENFGAAGSRFRLVDAAGIGEELAADKGELGRILVQKAVELAAERS